MTIEGILHFLVRLSLLVYLKSSHPSVGSITNIVIVFLSVPSDTGTVL